MANSFEGLVVVGLSTEQILTVVVVASFSFLVVASFLRTRQIEGRRSVEVLGRMKGEFFPQVEANLNEVLRGLEGSEVVEYAALLGRGLSAELDIEFRLRFQGEAGRMDRLRERLEEYEKGLVRLGERPGDSVPRGRLEAERLGLEERVRELLLDVRRLSSLERLPSRSPSIG